MSGKCIYCGKSSEAEYCSQVCNQEYYSYLGRVENFLKLYIACLIVALALLIVPVFVGHLLPFIGLAVLVAGIDFVTMPFAPQFVLKAIGVRKTELVLQAAGFIMAAAGVITILVTSII